jgi:hypothetical protein
MRNAVTERQPVILGRRPVAQVADKEVLLAEHHSVRQGTGGRLLTGLAHSRRLSRLVALGAGPAVKIIGLADHFSDEPGSLTLRALDQQWMIRHGFSSHQSDEK